MNDQVRNASREALKRKKLTQAEIAEQIGLQQSDVARLLTGRVGRIPENWQKLLDALDLVLVAIPRSDSHSLISHLQDVRNTSYELNPLVLLGLLHDLSKYSPTIQAHLHEIEEEVRAHAS